MQILNPPHMTMSLLHSGSLTQRSVVVPVLRMTFDPPSITPIKYHMNVM